MAPKQKNINGFTIIELLTVVVIIGILASITAAVFNGVQNRARDTKRISDLNSLSKILHLYSIDNYGDMIGASSGCGAYGKGSGWIHSDESTYPKSTRECLVEAGFRQAADITDPSGCSNGGETGCGGKPRYMILHCNKETIPVVYLLAYLQNIPQNASFADGLCDEGTSTGFASISNWDTAYGINYSLRVR